MHSVSSNSSLALSFPLLIKMNLENEWARRFLSSDLQTWPKLSDKGSEIVAVLATIGTRRHRGVLTHHNKFWQCFQPIQ